MGLDYALLPHRPADHGAVAARRVREVAIRRRRRANLEYHVQPISLDRFGDPPHPFPAFTASVCNLRPTSRGHVRIKSPIRAHYPAIAPNYLSTDEDRRSRPTRCASRAASWPAPRR